MRIGIIKRFLATILDAFALLGSAAILLVIVINVQWSSQSFAIGLTCTCIASIALCTAEVWLGASVGKLFLGLTIADATGRTSSFGQRLVRFSMKFFPLSVLFLVSVAPEAAPVTARVDLLVLVLSVAWVAGYCLAFGRNKQALHDRIAGTVVVARDSVVVSSRLTQTDAGTHCALIAALRPERGDAFSDVLFK
ncbi:MAG: RDD family protein [Deltaproteobacteria bacterium]|nr:RDD family protein [Deltaproteobacteria bacterium]